MGSAEEKFLNKIISNITDSVDGELIEYYDFDKEIVKKLLIDSFKKGGNEDLIKELENHNFFIVWQESDDPSNSSLVADQDWCVRFSTNMGIEGDYTFLYIEYPDEYDGVDLKEVDDGYGFELHLNQKFLHFRNACGWHKGFDVSKVSVKKNTLNVMLENLNG